VTRPLVYYAVSLFLGCLASLLLNENLFEGAVFAASFLTIIFLTQGRKFAFLVTSFFFIGIISYNLYFNVNINSSASFRVADKKGYYFIADCYGRKVTLKGNTSKLELGSKIIAKGKFEKAIDYQRGIVGNFDIDTYSLAPKDFTYKLYEIKNNIYSQFKSKIGEENSSLVMSLAFGDTRYLTKSDNMTFLKLGVIHAVSVSGLHISLIYQILEGILGIPFAVALSLVYVVFTGVQAPAVRSFFMILIFKLSKIAFKNYDNLSSLSLSALVILLWRPYYILDLGFNLSFLSTLGILFFYNKIRRKLFLLPQTLSGPLSLTISAQLFSLPYIAFTLQNFGLGFISGNLFLLPLYSALVVLGNAALLFSPFPPIFNVFCVIINNIMTSIDGAYFILLKYCPPLYYLNYSEGLSFMVVLMSVLLYFRGYNKLKTLPIFVVVLLFLQTYSIFPEVDILSSQYLNGVYLKYRSESILVCNYEDKGATYLMNLKTSLRVNKIVTNPNSNCSINFNKSEHFDIIQSSNSKFLNLCYSLNSKNIIFTSNNALANNLKVKPGYYDIIKVPQFNINEAKDVNSSYIIFLGKAIKIQ
jgi:competence protein ComEC